MVDRKLDYEVFAYVFKISMHVFNTLDYEVFAYVFKISMHVFNTSILFLLSNMTLLQEETNPKFSSHLE